MVENTLKEFIPFYSSLTIAQRLLVENTSYEFQLKKGELHTDTTCLGLFFVISGQLRAYVHSLDGKEITLFRILDYDGCILGSKCSLKNVSFDLTITALQDTILLVIPTNTYTALQKDNMVVKDFSLDMMATRLSEVMWIIEQFVFHSLDKRLASVLIDYHSLQQDNVLLLTHEEIANQIGSAREVITRALNYFAKEGIITLSRGRIEILDRRKLLVIAH